MKKFKFRIKYYFDSLQIKKNSLFNHIRLYFIQKDKKTLVCQSKHTEGDKVIFETSFQEDERILCYSQSEEKYQGSYLTMLLEFEAEQRFIKMGQINIDIASIANAEKTSQIMPYRIEKCFDRNANLLMNISLSYAQQMQSSNNMYDSISKSTYNLPLKLNSKNNGRNANKTEYLELEQHRENSILISQPRTSFNNHRQQRKSIEKTQTRNIFQQNSEINELSLEIASLNTDLRLTKQELAAVQQKYCELLSINENMQLELRQAHTQNYKMANICNQLSSKVTFLERTIDNQRQISSSQAQKYLALYQQSQQVRNKLLFEMDTIKNQQKQKCLRFQIKSAEFQNKTKKLSKQKEELKEQLRVQIIQTQKILKSYEKEKQLRKKIQEQNLQLKKSLQSINSNNEKLLSELNSYKAKNEEFMHQLELGRFSMAEHERELSELKIKVDQKNQLILKCQKEIENANQLINQQKLKCHQQISKMQSEFQNQQKSLELYIEQLESKTINEYSRLNQMAQLRKQISILNKKLIEQQDIHKELQNEMTYIVSEKEKSENLLREEQIRTLELTKDKIELQLLMKKNQQELLDLSLKTQNVALSKEEKDNFIKQCNAQRDKHWQNEVQKVESDTIILIEKWKKQKEQFTLKIQELEVEINSKQDENNQLNQHIKKLKQTMINDKKQIENQNCQLKSFKIKLDDKEAELWQRSEQLQQLTKKLNAFDGVEDSLIDLSNKIAEKNKEITVAKNNFEREKNIRIKQKVQIKEVVLNISNILTKSEKYKMYFQEFRGQTIDLDVINMLNSSFKIYCDKHNKVKQKLENLEQLQQQLENKEKQFDRLSNSRKIEKKLSKVSSKESLRSELEIDEHLSAINNAKQKQIKQIKEESLASLNLLKQENIDLKRKIQKQMDKARDAEKEAQKLEKILENYQYDYKKMSEEIQNKVEEIADLNLKLTNKENQLHVIKEELKDTTSDLTLTKNRLQEVNRSLQQQKNKNFFKKGASLLSSPSKSEESVKTSELEKKLKLVQQQLQRVKRQKQDRKREQVPVIKQIKQLEIKIKQKQNYILEIKKELEAQKARFEQEKEFALSREKKMKRDHQDQIEEWRKNQKDLKDKIFDEQERVRVLHKKIKQFEDSLRNSTQQATSTFEKEEKAKRLINTQWQLKLKGIETEHKNQLAVSKRMLEEQKSLQRSLRETIQQKQIENQNLINDLEKKQLKIEDLKAEIEVYGVKLKNFQDEEGEYKEKIEILETKIKIDSSRGSRKISQKQDKNYEQKSEFSLRAFTFR